MDKSVARFRRAVGSRAFLLFLLFAVLLIVTVSLYVVTSSNTESDDEDSSDVFWYITIAIVAMVTLIFLIAALTCPACMTPIRQELSDQPVVYHRNPERVSISHDNHGADIESEVRTVESSGQPRERESSNLISSETQSSLVRRERSLSAPPYPRVPRRSAMEWSILFTSCSSPSSSEMDGYGRGRRRNARPNDRQTNYASASRLSRAIGDLQRQKHVHPRPLSAPERVQQYLPSFPPPAPYSSPVSENGGDEESVSLTTVSTLVHSSSSGIDGNGRTSSSPTPCTGSTTTLSSNSPSDTPAELSSGPGVEKGRPPVTDLPFYTGHAIAQSIAARQRIASEIHHGYAGRQFGTAESSLQRWRHLNLPAGDTSSDNGSIEASSTSDRASVAQEEEESVQQSHVTNPLQVDEEIAGPSDVKILVQDDERETEVGLVMQMATSFWRAAWGSFNRWVQPAAQAPSPDGAAAEGPETPETGSVVPSESRFERSSSADGSPQGTPGEQNSPGSPSRPAHTGVNMTSCAQPDQEGEDVLPTEKRERQ